MRLTVPRRGGWRAWGPVRADVERALADPADPAVAAAEIASEHRRGANYVKVTFALTISATDVADALTIAWDAFRDAVGDNLAGWEVTAAAAEVQPEPPLTGASGLHLAVLSVKRSPAASVGDRSHVSCDTRQSCTSKSSRSAVCGSMTPPSPVRDAARLVRQLEVGAGGAASSG